MSRRPILNITDNAISSPESADGRSPPNSPDGPIVQFGPGLARVSLFQSQEKNNEHLTQETYGRTFERSLPRKGPWLSLENKLRKELAKIGCPERTLIWKEKVIASGLVVSHLTPLEPRSNGSDTTGLLKEPWSAATTTDFGTQHGSGDLLLSAQMTLIASNNPVQMYHKIIAKKKNPKHFPRHLKELHSKIISGMTLNGSGASGIKNGAAPNPAFPGWLMGFPAEWISSAVSAMQSVSRLPKKSLKLILTRTRRDIIGL